MFGIGAGVSEAAPRKVALLYSEVLDHFIEYMAPAEPDFAEQVRNRNPGTFDKPHDVSLGHHKRGVMRTESFHAYDC